MELCNRVGVDFVCASSTAPYGDGSAGMLLNEKSDTSVSLEKTVMQVLDPEFGLRVHRIRTLAPRGSSARSNVRRFIPAIEAKAMPAKLSLQEFYTQVVQTQKVLTMKHLGWSGFRVSIGLAAKLLAQGQTNFVNMLLKFNKAYDMNRLLADHRREVKYEISLPKSVPARNVDPSTLFIHPQQLLKSIGTGHAD